MSQNLLPKQNINKKLIYTIIFVLLVSNIFFIYKYLNSQPEKNESHFTMLDPARKFLPAKSYITNIEKLRTYLKELAVEYPDSISIYYENINSGANISINKDVRLFPASLSKLIQAIIITQKVEEGVLSFDQELKALPFDLSSDSGNLYQTIGDAPISVDNLLKELLVNSDNTAQNIFKHYLTFEDYSDFQNATGLQDLYNENGFISAKEYTRILRVLYTSNFLEPENSQKILQYMAQATFKDYLSQGIPSDIKFAHKYGENKDYNIFADSGIVYVPNKPYMISVIIKGKDSSSETRAWAVNLMKEISKNAYDVSK